MTPQQETTETNRNMNYNTATLPNGLRIIHCPSASPVVYCGYAVNAGTRNETAEEEGMAHFCEHITFKGTARRSALQVINCLERVGGELNAFTTKEHTVYYSAILRDHFTKAADLLTDIVFHSNYPQHEIDKEVEVICDEIESYNDTPAELIYDEFENLIFNGHPLGHNILGTAGRLRTYTTADAMRFTRRHYRPDNAVFFAYGDLDFNKLVAALRKAAGDTCGAAFTDGGDALLCGEKTLHDERTADTVVMPDYAPREMTIERNTHQAHVMIGNRAYCAHDERRTALFLLNNILGGPGMNAKLNLSLRERHGLVYTVESSMVAYSDTGMWSVYFGCDPHDVKRCRRLVRRELDRMMEHTLTPAQLNAAKRQIKGQIAVACDNRENFALDFGKTYLKYGIKKDMTALFDRIDALTAEQIRQVAEDMFAEDRLTTLIIR